MSVINDYIFKQGFRQTPIKRWINQQRLPYNLRNVKKAMKALTKRGFQRREVSGTDVAFQGPASERRIVFGRCKIGGVITFAHVSADHGTLHLIITLAGGHRMDAIEKLYFNDEEVTFPSQFTASQQAQGATGKFENLVRMQFNRGANGQTALSEAVANTGGLWDSTCTQAGCPHVYLKLTWNEAKFSSGVPDISFLVRGMYTTFSFLGEIVTRPSEWTQNPASIALWFANDEHIGLGLEYANGDIFNWDDAWTTCNQDVVKADGSTEKRYTCNGEFSSSTSRRAILDEIVSSMGGSYKLDSGIEFGTSIFAARAWPIYYTITEKDILDVVRIDTAIPQRESVGGVRGTYVEPSEDYEEKSFPAYRYPTDPYRYGRFEDISLPMVHSRTQAQRLAKIAFWRHVVYQLTIELVLPLEWYVLYPPAWVGVTMERYNWTDKKFEVESIQPFYIDKGHGKFLAVRVRLHEVEDDIFTFTTAEEVGITTGGPLTLPEPGAEGVTNPSALNATSGTSTVLVQPDGSILNRVLLQWTAPQDAFVRNGGTIEIEFKPSSSGTWTPAATVSGNTTAYYATGVQAGIYYDFRIRARQSSGIYGDYVSITNHLVQTSTAPPSNVSNFIGQTSGGNLSLTWNDVPEGNISFYRIKKTTSGQPWEDCALVAEAIGQPVIADNTGTPTFKIKAVNSLGIESATATDHVAYSAPGTGSPVGLLLSLTQA